MKKFFKVNGFGCVVYLAMLVLVQIIGVAMFGLGLYGWFQGGCDLAAVFGISVGFMALLLGMIKFGEVKDKAKERIANEEK